MYIYIHIRAVGLCLGFHRRVDCDENGGYIHMYVYMYIYIYVCIWVNPLSALRSG